MRADVTIIGGGPVGLFAAFYSGMRGMSTRIIDSLPELGGQLTALYPEKAVYDMPGFPSVLAKDLARDMIHQGTRFEPELVLGRTAVRLDRDEEGYTLTLDNGETVATRTLIIAAGAGAFSPTKLGVEREDEFSGKGITYGVKSKEAFRDRNVYIVGGGDSAFDWCLELEPLAKSVTLVHRRDQFRAHEESVRQLAMTSVQKMLWTVTKELHGEDRLTHVTFENSQTHELIRREVDDLIVTIGFKSTLGPLKEWGLEIEKNQIKVNPLFQTNLPGVFAVGDVATYEGKLKLIATGVGEAASAVCQAKVLLDPGAKLFPGHSSDLDL